MVTLDMKRTCLHRIRLPDGMASQHELRSALLRHHDEALRHLGKSFETPLHTRSTRVARIKRDCEHWHVCANCRLWPEYLHQFGVTVQASS